MDTRLCGICSNDCKQPKVINCHHSFCFTCLEDYINKVSTNNKFLCPKCRHNVNIPIGGVMDFASNEDVQQELLSDICKVEVPPCDVCKTDVDSKFRCEDCEQHFCRTTHDGFKLFRGHKILDINVALQIPSDDNARSESTDLYPNHHVTNPKCVDPDSNVRTRGELKSLQSDIEIHISQFEHFCESLTKIKTDLDNSAQKSCEAVEKQVEQISSDAKQVGEEIIAEIQKSRDEEKDKIIKPLREMEILIEDLKASVKCTVDVIEQDVSIAQVLNRIRQVKQEQERCRLRKLDIPDVNYMWFQESVIDKTMLAKQLGSLKNENGPMFQTGFNLGEFELGDKRVVDPSTVKTLFNLGECKSGDGHAVDGSTSFTLGEFELGDGHAVDGSTSFSLGEFESGDRHAVDGSTSFSLGEFELGDGHAVDGSTSFSLREYELGSYAVDGSTSFSLGEFKLGRRQAVDGTTFTTSFNLDEVTLAGRYGVDGADDYIQGLPWTINVVKIEKSDNVPTLGIYQGLRKIDDTADIKSCQADRRLTLINIRNKQHSENREYSAHTYKPGESWGWAEFIDWDRFVDKQNGFLDDDNNFIIQTTVRIIRIDRC